MNKNKIAIAAFAIIAVASVARAQIVSIDFDGKAGVNAPIGQEILSLGDASQIPVSAPAMMPQRVFSNAAEVDKSTTFIELPAARRESFRKAVLSYSGDSARILSLVDDNNVKILYGHSGILFLGKTAGKYQVIAESNDRTLLLGAGKSLRGGPVCKLVEYVLWKLIDGVWTEVIKQVKECSSPENYDGIADYQNSGFPKAAAMQNGRAPGCVYVLVEYVLWKLVDGVWTEVIKQVKECASDIDTDPNTHAGSGSTYHAGQGGSSNYDVNKLLK